MKHRLFSPVLALTLALAASEPAHAQQTLPDSRDKSGEGAKLAYSRQITDVKYDSLPLEEIVARLRKDFPEINFILPEDLSQVIVRLEMRNVTLAEILEAVQIAGRSEHLMFEQVNERLITFRRDEAAVQLGTPQPALRTFNLRGYLVGRDQDAIRRALEELHQVLEESWVMLQGANPALRKTGPPVLRMHAGTQMLISVSNPEQLQVLEEIVYALPGMERPATSQAHQSSGSGYGGMPGAMMSGGGGTAIDERFLRRYGSGGGGEGTGGPATR